MSDSVITIRFGGSSCVYNAQACSQL